MAKNKSKGVVKVADAEIVSKDYSVYSPREQAAFQCRDKIEGALRGASTAFYDLSTGLLEAYDNDYAKVYGFGNFSEYVESNLDMKYRTAYYMVEIARVVKQLGIDRARVERIGWAKMKGIAWALSESPDEKEKYLEMAETMSQRALDEKIREEREAKIAHTEGREARAAVMRVSLKLEGDAASVVSDALALAYNDIGREDASLAFQHIAGEWMVARNASPGAVTLDDWIAYIEKAYGTKLVRVEEASALDALLSGETSTDEDAELEALLNATESDLDGLSR